MPLIDVLEGRELRAPFFVAKMTLRQQGHYSDLIHRGCFFNGSVRRLCMVFQVSGADVSNRGEFRYPLLSFR